MEEEESLSTSAHTGTAARHFLREMIVVDVTYLTGPAWFGRVKLLQFIFVTLAGILTPSVPNGLLFSRYAFFVFIVWTSFMYISLDLLLHLTSLWRRLPPLMTSSAILVFPLLIGVVVFLIGSSLIASATHTLLGAQNTTSALSATCGFIVMVLYAVEVFLHFQAVQKERAPPPAAPLVNPARNRPISHPVTLEAANPYPPPYKDCVVDGPEPSGGGSGSVYVTEENTFH